MNKYIDFLNKLTELTLETGIVIEDFGDAFYQPYISTEGVGTIYISWNENEKRYIGRKGNGYDGEIIG